MIGQRNHDIRYNVVLHPYIFVNIAILRSGATSEGLASQDIHIPDFFKFVGLSGQKITRTGNTAKYAGPGCPTKFVACVFCFAPEIGNATGMPERSRSTRN